MSKRILIGFFCVAITLLDQLYIRSLLIGIHPIVDVIVGSLPNFLAVISLSLLVVHITLRYNLNFFNSNSLISVFVTLGVVAYELFPHSTINKSFGGTFDYYDITASIVGGIVSYLIEKKCFSK